jgi:hypothetical protein
LKVFPFPRVCLRAGLLVRDLIVVVAFLLP